MTTVEDVRLFMEEIAPSSLKEDWDNVGLLVGDPHTRVDTILVALDPFEAVIEEAAECNAQLIVTHHPLIFTPLKQITSENEIGKCIMSLIQYRISAINAHTNLDVAVGGVNDCLAERLGLSNVSIPYPQGEMPDGRSCGLLRIGTAPVQNASSFAEFVKERLHCSGIRFVDGGRPVQKVAVGGGACGSELKEVIAAGCDTFVTSDVKYNQFWDAKDAGITLIDAGHYFTENPVCDYLVAKLREKFPEIRVILSKKHQDPVIFG